MRDLRFSFKENLEAELQLTFLYGENAYKVLGLVSCLLCKESSALLTLEIMGISAKEAIPHFAIYYILSENCIPVT